MKRVTPSLSHTKHTERLCNIWVLLLSCTIFFTFLVALAGRLLASSWCFLKSHTVSTKHLLLISKNFNFAQGESMFYHSIGFSCRQNEWIYITYYSICTLMKVTFIAQIWTYLCISTLFYFFHQHATLLDLRVNSLMLWSQCFQKCSHWI